MFTFMMCLAIVMILVILMVFVVVIIITNLITIIITVIIIIIIIMSVRDCSVVICGCGGCKNINIGLENKQALPFIGSTREGH